MKNANNEIVKMTAGEEAFIDRFAADYCRPHKIVAAERLSAYVAAQKARFISSSSQDFVLAAGAHRKHETTEVKSPDEEVVFSFVSECASHVPGAWKATLSVPPNATPETMLTLEVADAKNDFSAAGIFKLSGIALPVIGGKTQILFGAFLAGIKNTDVSFKANDGAEVKGTLAFFC